jgi:hypothetical protein
VYDNANGKLLSINNVALDYAANTSIPPFFLSDKENLSLSITVVGETSTFEGQSVNIYHAEPDFTGLSEQMAIFLEKLRLPYIKSKDAAVTMVTVPDKHVFIMSDNRFEGVDSRHFGTVPIAAMESILRREVAE